jgi:DNA-binding response OmpR family regulator
MYCSRAGGARFSSSHLVNSTFYHTNLLAAYLLFFEEDGYEIRAVKDRQEALFQYCAWHPQAVVLDIQTPNSDGRA